MATGLDGRKSAGSTPRARLTPLRSAGARGEPVTAKAWLAAHLARFGGDPVEGIDAVHGPTETSQDHGSGSGESYAPRWRWCSRHDDERVQRIRETGK